MTQYLVIALVAAIPEETFGCRIIKEGELYPMIYRVVYGPRSYWECSEWIDFHCKPIVKWWETEKAAALAQTDGFKNNKAALPLLAAETRRVEIGHIDGIPEFKTEWEGGFIKYPVLYTRHSKLTAYAEFSAPDINSIWGDITSCASGAAVVATIAAILASPAAALPAFKAAFMACIVPKLGDRASQISVSLSTEQTHDDWHRV